MTKTKIDRIVGRLELGETFVRVGVDAVQFGVHCRIVCLLCGGRHGSRYCPQLPWTNERREA